MTTQQGGLQAGSTGKRLLWSKEALTPPCSTIFQTQGVRGLNRGDGKGLNPAFRGDWGEGGEPSTPPPGAQLLGCWFCFSFKSGLRQRPASLKVILPVYLN